MRWQYSSSITALFGAFVDQMHKHACIRWQYSSSITALFGAFVDQMHKHACIGVKFTIHVRCFVASTGERLIVVLVALAAALCMGLGQT